MGRKPAPGKKSANQPRDNKGTQVIHSPYNFVPLSEWVFLPEWGGKVSHDIPFSDGLCGEIEFRVEAHTPLLIGGRRVEKQGNTPARVQPFRLTENGPFAIPGSSLKGMLRAVVEIAGFGRMRMVDDKRYAVRDLTKEARQFYREKMTGKENINGKMGYRPWLRAGWLKRDPKTGEASIVPCEYARVEHDDLAAFSGDMGWENLKRLPEPKAKYDKWKRKKPLEIWFDPGEEKVHRHSQPLIYRRAEKLGSGQTRGTLVFTGQPAPRVRDKPGRKHMEFIFFDSREDDRKPIPERVWQDFLHIHQPHDPRDTSGKIWNYWKNEQYVPVFYLTDGNGQVASLGLALMYRLAYHHSIGTAIDNTSTRHRESPSAGSGYDLADLLFGATGEQPEDALRGRVSIEAAVATSDAEPQPQEDTILASPKPTFYPNYVVQQQQATSPGKIKGDTYTTFMANNAEIRGFKRYPARLPEKAGVEPCASPRQDGNAKKEKGDNQDVKVRLNPLPAGTVFEGRLVFHNLRPMELGALLWAMTWGGGDRYRHSLGMGKPFGFGQVTVRIDEESSSLEPNDPRQGQMPLDEETRQRLMKEFVERMESESANGNRGCWGASPQIANLLAMADPSNAEAFTSVTGCELRYMRLNEGKEFQQAKKDYATLPMYAEVINATGAANVPAGYGHDWLDEMIPKLMKEHNTRDKNVIGGKLLAEEWKQIEESAERAAVAEAIHALWTRQGLFETKPGKSMKNALQIYGWTANGERMQ